MLMRAGGGAMVGDMKIIVIPAMFSALLALSACDLIAGKEPVAPAPAVAPLGIGQDAAALDATTEAERAAALADAAGARELGTVVAALGSPAEQGFWLSADIIATTAPGRVETASGQSVAVELRPGEGGALLSLAAYRALGLALTDLPELRVFAE
jgi:hypothetical protein